MASAQDNLARTMSEGSTSSMSGSESSSDAPMELCARRPSPPASDVSELSDGVDGDVDDDKLPPLGSAPTGLPFIGYDDDTISTAQAWRGAHEVQRARRLRPITK